MSTDRNFDDLAERFARKIHQSFKGRIRQRVVERDLAEHWPLEWCQSRQRVLDAGGGQGRMARYLAEGGHSVVLCDVSREMLKLAERELAGAPPDVAVELRQASIQELAPEYPAHFDLVVCHAVLEWLADPRAVLAQLVESLAPGGYLSLVYYNLHGLVYHNLLRGNFRKVVREDWRGHPGSLTPSTPLRPEAVAQWLAALPLTVVCESGVRVFSDYVETPRRNETDTVEMELRFSRRAPYKHLGRYLHLLCRKDEGGDC